MVEKEYNGNQRNSFNEYKQLHLWIRKKKVFPKDLKCQICKQFSDKLEVSNKSGLYLWDTEDYLYCCPQCNREMGKDFSKRGIKNRFSNVFIINNKEMTRKGYWKSERFLKRYNAYVKRNRDKISESKRRYYNIPEVKLRRKRYCKEYYKKNRNSLLKKDREEYRSHLEEIEK